MSDPLTPEEARRQFAAALAEAGLYARPRQRIENAARELARAVVADALAHFTDAAMSAAAATLDAAQPAIDVEALREAAQADRPTAANGRALDAALERSRP